MEELSFLQRIVVWIVPILFAITVHETAHGWMAMRLGDPTARMLGRLTLNPIKHIDPLGTVLVPGLLLLFGGFIFGWAKPVPVTWQNLKNPRRDMALVALAGPLANLGMALVWGMLIQVGLALNGAASAYLVYSGVAGVFINTLLMVLNLLPLPPLDGGRVASGLLRGKLAWHFDRLEPYGFPILVILLVTGLLGEILWPVVSVMLSGLSAVAGLSSDSFQLLLYALVG